MTPPKDAEREHAFEVARAFANHHAVTHYVSDLADLIARERAAARDAALDEAAAVAAKRAEAKHSAHFIRSRGGSCDACTEAGVVATLIRALKGKVTP